MGKQPSIKTPPAVGVSPEGIIPEEKPVISQDPMDVQEMIRRDIEEAGPVAETLRRNEFGDANPLYFTEDSSQICGAAS